MSKDYLNIGRVRSASILDGETILLEGDRGDTRFAIPDDAMKAGLKDTIRNTDPLEVVDE